MYFQMKVISIYHKITSYNQRHAEFIPT